MMLFEVHLVSVRCLYSSRDSSWPGNLNWGNLVRSPPPYKRWSLVISSVRFFWYAGPASTTPPAALRHHKPDKITQSAVRDASSWLVWMRSVTHLLLVLYSRILSRKSFCTGSRSLALLKATADRPMFLRSVTLTAERSREDRRNSRWRAIVSTHTHTQYISIHHLLNGHMLSKLYRKTLRYLAI